MKKNFITSINNENKMYPPLYLTPIEYEHDGRYILYIRVPVSSTVCRCNGRIYDRNHEADIDITNHADEELLRSAGLILTDDFTQQEGITLAAILLFGKDSTIMSVLPQHKTDTIFRVQNVDRYDDRDVVITNLIESYDRLFPFGEKHLNDTFHLEEIQSVSARLSRISLCTAIFQADMWRSWS